MILETQWQKNVTTYSNPKQHPSLCIYKVNKIKFVLILVVATVYNDILFIVFAHFKSMQTAYKEL